MSIEIHKKIKKQLDYFVKTKKIPHIILHGPLGSGKRTLLKYLIDKIYTNKNNVMYVNCGHGKGIKFIRDELKFFAKSNIKNHNKGIFKSIILLNADKLTTDAQSALRRCIEQFSNNTRFFIIVEKKEKLLKPIISRFCNIFVEKPIINSKNQNLHSLKFENITIDIEKKKFIKKNLSVKDHSVRNCFNIANKLYEKGYSFLDLLYYFKNSEEKFEDKGAMLIYFDKVRKEFRNEKLLIFNFVSFYFIRKNLNLENIDSM
jgi:replication-associated recombination protein RarA|uniref:AAA+ ATPase domain-containing protein n=1 Tax=viral metagenome TaxID=1070528 RepID=A0A6C0C045_9ZZZZ